MNEQEILEGNRLIAEFEGMKLVHDDPIAYPDGYMFSEEDGAHELKNMKYHNDWNWLMPVIEKIEAMGYISCIELLHHGEHRVFFNSIETLQPVGNGARGSTKIEAVYLTVLDFIKTTNP